MKAISEELKRRILGDMRQADIVAAAHNVSKSTVCLYRNAAGIRGDYFPRISTPEDRETARKMRATGMSYEKIARALGFKTASVHRWLYEPLAKEKKKQKPVIADWMLRAGGRMK